MQGLRVAFENCDTWKIREPSSRDDDEQDFIMDPKCKELDVLNQNYAFNDMLARALVQLLPQEERRHITIWLDKLHSISGDKAALMKRNDYTWLLLLAMQSGKVTEPFDKLPPVNDLPEFSDIMPPELFQELLTSTEENSSWIDDLISGADAVTDDNGNTSNSVPPWKFLERQPQPVNGITCYFSVFSNES